MLALLIVLFLFVVVVISGLRKESYSVLDRLDPQLWRHLHH